MQRESKLTRLPRAIREQLNRRLDNGEPTAKTLEWLNSLPEVKALVAAEFAGKPISKSNLSKYKKTVLRKWQIRQTAIEFALTETDTAPGQDPLPASMTEKLAEFVAIRFAALAHTLAPADGDPQAELHILQELASAIVALRRGDLNAERVRLEQQHLAILKTKSDQHLEALFWEWTKRPDIHKKLFPNKSRDEIRREAERILNYKLLGIPYPDTFPEETDEPAILI